MIIGQEKLVKKINKMKIEKIPGLLVLQGPAGSGKKLLTGKIVDKVKGRLLTYGVGINDVREAIDLAYKQHLITFYAFFDADNMSHQAKNALLKVTEEVPNKSRFVLTCQNLSTLPETLQSRALVYSLEPYKPKEILEYVEQNNFEIYGLDNFDIQDFVINLCQVPGDVNLLANCNINEFYGFVRKVADNLHLVSGANALKIPENICFKDDGEGWDINLFLRGMSYVYKQAFMFDKKAVYKDLVKLTNKYIQKLQVKSVNKKYVLDSWIFEARKIYFTE